MSIIAPSILSSTFLELGADIKAFSDIENIWIHLDVMDGHYVPNLSFGAPVLKNLSSATQHPLDAHLMVTNPQDYIESFKSLNLHNFTFHWEAVTHQDSLVQNLKPHFKSVGISLNPATPISDIPLYILKEIDLILLMSVNPGFGGQSFIEATYDKLQELDLVRKKNKLDFKIQIDGGVTDKNSAKLLKLGADILVAGSFVFKNGRENFKHNINKLRD